MDFIVSAIAFVVIFSVIILIHEFGHFWVARKSGIKVEEFGLGMPPRIWGKKIKGVLYSINWIPFGGFVRLFGEDSSDPKILKDPKSFASKPLRKRMAVVVAGVFMNFVLAIILLTIGFSIGIEPLLVNSDDVLGAINDGIIEIDNGARVKSVEEGSLAESAGLKANDLILKINGQDLRQPFDQVLLFGEDELADDMNLEIYRDGNISKVTLNKSDDSKVLGIEMYGMLYLPRVVIRDIAVDSDSVNAGLQVGDVILSMNDKPIYFVSDYQLLVSSENEIEYKVVRNHEELVIPVKFEDTQRVVVVNVVPESPAASAGFKSGDIVVSVNDTFIGKPEDSINVTKANIGKELKYKVNRDGKEIELTVKPSDQGIIGVNIISMASYKNNQLSVYNADFLTTVKKVNDIKYPIHIAFIQSFKETGRLAVLTLDMFGNLVRSITSQFIIPEGVAGPVGIATMTHMFVQQGLLALLRFTALLSLSLAVINIIPFPALDGGRLIFLLVEAIRGKRVSAKWEALIHAFGFILLMGLIVMITWSDILNIFL